MWRLADRQLDEFVGAGRCEFITRLRPALRHARRRRRPRGARGGPPAVPRRLRPERSPGRDRRRASRVPACNALGWLDDWFASYIEDRRRQPRNDVLTDLALGHLPRRLHARRDRVVRTATFLFAAGQETTARLLAVGLKYLCEYPELQDELRAHRERIPDFIEEALAHREPGEGRLPPGPPRRRRSAASTSHAGTPVMLLNGAANRDPRRVRVSRRVPPRPTQRQGAHRLRAWRPLLSGRPAGPRRGPSQHRAHPRPDARHPALRGAPRAARSPTLRVRADVGPARACTSCTSSSPRPRRRDERPGRRRDRRRLGHRPRRRPAIRGRRSRVALLDRDAAGLRDAAAGLSERAHRGAVRGRRRRPRLRGACVRIRPGQLGPTTILVTSAGVESFDPVLDITPEKWDRILAVNLTGTFTCMQLAAAGHDRRRAGAAS